MIWNFIEFLFPFSGKKKKKLSMILKDVWSPRQRLSEESLSGSWSKALSEFIREKEISELNNTACSSK